MISGLNPNNNEDKRNDIMELWYNLTGEKFGKVNLATNEDFNDAIPADKRTYMTSVRKKEIPLVAEQPIVINGNKNLHFVNFSNTHYFDISNHMKGIEDKTDRRAILDALQNKDNKDKTVAFFAGNFIGSEWLISSLNNAAIDEKNKILFWGLQNRVEQLIQDIVYVAQNGADEIILMNGREEHNAKQKLNVNVLENGFVEKFNKLVSKYIVERVNRNKSLKKSNKQVIIKYVEGVKKVFNVQKNFAGKTTMYDISMHTNIKTTATTINANYNAANRQHGGLTHADVMLIACENAAGIPHDDKKIILMSGLSKYSKTTKGNVPTFAPKGYNNFTMMLGENNHEVEIVRSPIITNDKTHTLERLIAVEEKKAEILEEIATMKINEKFDNFACRKVDYKRMCNQINEQGGKQ